MTLEEAIKRRYEVLDREDMCEEYKQEYLQLTKWLEKLKQGGLDMSDDDKICKRFSITATIDENHKMNVSTENEGMSALEIVGILECKKQDIIKQIYESTQFTRTLVKDKKEESITNK